jgi:hypothetical protein
MIKRHDSSKSSIDKEIKAVMTTPHSTSISPSSSAISPAMNLTANSIAMNAEYIGHHDVIQRYLYRTLTDTELSAFEIYLLCHPELIAEIEQQKIINAVFREELGRDKRWLQSAVSVPSAPSWWRQAVPLAACMLFAFYVGLNSQLAPQSREVSQLNTVVLQSLRGPQALHDIRLSALQVVPSLSSMVAVPLHIDVGPQLEPNQRYHLQLWQPATGVVLANVDQLQAEATGWLDYKVEVSANLRGQFQLEISAAADRDQQHFQVLFQ